LDEIAKTTSHNKKNQKHQPAFIRQLCKDLQTKKLDVEQHTA
ncbi:20306_t:CDS:2, partial [Gigaspora margarita]